MEAMKTHEEMHAELLAKAAEDDGFRAWLIEDPKAAIKDALNLDLPDAVTVRVFEDDAATAHLVLPPSADLTDAELEAIGGGHSGMYIGYHKHPGQTYPHS